MSEFELILLNNTDQPILITDQDIFGEGTLQKKFNPSMNVNGPPNYIKASSNGILRGSFKMHVGVEMHDCSFTHDDSSGEPVFESSTVGEKVSRYELLPQPPVLGGEHGIDALMVIIVESSIPIKSAYRIRITNKTSQSLVMTNRDSDTQWEEEFHYEETNNGPYDIATAKAIAVSKPVKGFFQLAIGSDAVFNCQFSFNSSKDDSPVFNIPSTIVRQYMLTYAEPRVSEGGIACIDAAVRPLSTFEIVIVNKMLQDLEISDKSDNINIPNQIGSHKTEKALARADGALNGSFVIAVPNAKFTCTYSLNIEDPRAKPSFKVAPKSVGKIHTSLDKPTYSNDMAVINLTIASK